MPRGCRAYENSDDGFDFINAPGTCIVEGSWSFRNGFIPDTNMAGANGAGFKSGGFGEPPNIPATGVPRHVVRGNLAFGNRAIGVYANHHPGGIDFFDNTAFDNPVNFNMLASGMSSHKLRNNLAVEPGRAITSFNGGTDTNNSWSLQVEVSEADFLSVDRAQALMPRQADGSLPKIAFMHLANDSDLIDRGEDVGLPFSGSAPDLGAFESGSPATAPPADAGVPDAAIGGVAGMAMPMAGASAPLAGAAGTRTAPSPAGAAGSTMPPPPPGLAGGASSRSPVMMAGAGPSMAGASAGGAQLPTTPAVSPVAQTHCGCRLAHSSDSSGWLGLLALGTLAALRRRRVQAFAKARSRCDGADSPLRPT